MINNLLKYLIKIEKIRLLKINLKNFQYYIFDVNSEKKYIYT